MSTQPGFDALDLHRQHIERTRENSARVASAYAVYTSTGSGEAQPADAILFGTPFTERPSVAYGNTLLSEPVDGHMPRCSGGVVKWVVNSDGLYTGAWIYATVDDLPAIMQIAGAIPGVAQQNYQMEHYFTFTGVAMKSIPLSLLGGL